MVTDQDQLTEIEAVLSEDATFSNGLWSLTEVLGYWNQRQYRFLQETKILAAWASIPWVVHVEEQPLPIDWVATIAAAWRDFATNRSTVLPRSDRFELDHVEQTYATTSGRPQGYRDVDTPTLTLGIVPAPANPGAVELVYVSLSEVLDGTGVYFTVPDEWVPYLKYGVYADMLGKDGRGQDLLRARYAEQRYQEGIILAQSLLQGWG